MMRIFKFQDSIILLERTPSVLASLLKDLPEEWTIATEGPETWSPYDVVGHLVHGEKTDWIPRIMMVMNDSGQTFEPYDRFAQFEMSKGKTLSELLSEFESLRRQNLIKLKALEIGESDLDRRGIHPSLGPVTLRNLLAAWVVHDQGHISQISRVIAKQYKDEVGPWIRYLTILKHTPKE